MLTVGNNSGTTNGTTEVVVVDSPGTDETRIIRNITIFNNDTAPCTYELLLVDSVGPVTRVITRSGAVAANGSFGYTDTLTLDSTTESIKVRLIAAKTTNDCDFTSHYVTEG